MILRAMPVKAEKQRNENIELSLERAEEAVQIGDLGYDFVYFCKRNNIALLTEESRKKSMETLEFWLFYSDSKDGLSWLVLGNAFLTLFISPIETKKDCLNLAFEAYLKAESLGQKSNPDLHYNRAQLQLFSESWTEAYDSLKLSSTLGFE